MAKTIGVIVQDVKQETDAHVREHENKVKSVFLHAAGIISIAAIAGAILQYLYNTGYYAVYHISKECIVINLQKYLKFSTILFLVIQLVPNYLIMNKNYIVLNKTGIDVKRYIIGLTIILAGVLGLNLFSVIPLWVIGVTVLLLSISLELVHIRWKNIDSKLNKRITRWQEKKTRERLVEDRIWFSYAPSWIGLIALLLVFAPSYGELQAKAKKEYQLFTVNDESYAVVVDLNDKVIAEKASVDSNILSIDTERYLYVKKDAIAFTNASFEDVILSSHKNMADELPVDETTLENNEP